MGRAKHRGEFLRRWTLIRRSPATFSRREKRDAWPALLPDWAVLALLALMVFPACERRPALRLATTTSVDNSGLLNTLLPAFKKQTGIDVEVLSVGSGKAMQLGLHGDADLLVTHDPAGETAFLKSGKARLYRKIMYNDFLIVGPADDRAHVGAATSAIEAMKRIAQSDAPFVSRGDASGTEAREKLFWKKGGATPPPPRLVETGQGMAATLRVASQLKAYCLTDRATFSQLAHLLALRELSHGDPEFLNTYAVMVIGTSDKSRGSAAVTFAEWISTGAGREMINDFRIRGSRVFNVWPPNRPHHNPDVLPF
ncbi:MAG TPA: substrate-binding domain-containing protein [Thermoanaerobaculia bacterium]|nr:substrate-binding domain-containing protein [Thermoanaerobaculia bacterium]